MTELISSVSASKRASLALAMLPASQRLRVFYGDAQFRSGKGQQSAHEAERSLRPIVRTLDHERDEAGHQLAGAVVPMRISAALADDDRIREISEIIDILVGFGIEDRERIESRDLFGGSRHRLHSGD